MKHPVNTTAILILIFLSAQLIGLVITSEYIDFQKTEETGQVNWQQLPIRIGKARDRSRRNSNNDNNCLNICHNNHIDNNKTEKR